jgi:hypothetical protein
VTSEPLIKQIAAIGTTGTTGGLDLIAFAGMLMGLNISLSSELSKSFKTFELFYKSFNTSFCIII